MSIFQKSIVKKHISSENPEVLKAKWNLFTSYFHNATIQENIYNSKEEQFQEGFLRELFVKVLGYTLNPEPNFNLTTEYKNIKDSKKADGAIIINNTVTAVIELKGTATTDLGKVESQAFNYKNNQHQCLYVITSNFEKLRFYIDNAIEHIEFNLFKLTEEEFQLLYLCLAFKNIENNVPKNIKDESVSQEDVITKKLYNNYSLFKKELHHNLVALNPGNDPLELFRKSQKLLDRFLFIFFAEDRGLLPTNLIFRINKEWQQLREMRIDVSLYDRYKIYFSDLNVGAKVSLPAFSQTASNKKEEFQIYAYNGGLFKEDDELNTLKIDDELLFKHTEKLSNYDFASEVDVNILGHIFENSLNELDEIKAQIEGQEIDKTKTKRKKDGVFYTPKYITKYIVDNTVGKLCTDKKFEFKIIEEEYITDKKRNKATIQNLAAKLSDYRNWLLKITICDPACGSGAFLNQALDFLINEHKYIDELQAKLFGDAIVMSDVEQSILENNIFGVDINEESVEIAKLSLWLRTAQPNRKLNDLNSNIKCGNSLIDDVSVAGDKAFNWEQQFTTVFEKGGFDVVIGNPPYVRHELLGLEQKEYFEKKYVNVYNGIADLYIYFYSLSFKLLLEKGRLGFITPNKWLERKYGFELRNFLIDLKIEQIVNMNKMNVFDDAIADPSIFLFTNTKDALFPIKYKCPINSAELYNNDFEEFDKSKLETDMWRFSKSANQSIIDKFKNADSTIIKYTHGGVYYGIKTGLNEAFIINNELKDIIVQEDNKSNEVVVKMVEGEDFKRWHLNHSGRYMLATGYDIDIPKKYPSVFKHLLTYETKLIKRSDKGKNFWNLRSCDYYDKLSKPKIIYYHTAINHNFYFDDEGYYISANCYFISNADHYLQCLLNSTLFNFMKGFLFPHFGDVEKSRGVRLDGNIMNNLPIKNIPEIEKEFFKNKAISITKQSRLFEDFRLKFLSFFNEKWSITKNSRKLDKWYTLEFVDFIKELNKSIKAIKGVPLSKKDEFDWIDLFNENKQKAQALKSQIDATDKEIDQLVYKLYDLTEEEIAIVEKV